MPSDQLLPHGADATPSDRQVVAVVLTHGSRLCLLRRSRLVGHDRGLWHCITGYVSDGIEPDQQAITELEEETGLATADLGALTAGQVLTLRDSAGADWTVFTYRCEVSAPRLRINWEHDAYSWVRSMSDSTGDIVSWLPDVLNAVGA